MALSYTETASCAGTFIASALFIWQSRKAEQNKADAEAAKQVALAAQKKLDSASTDDLAKKNHEIAEAYKIKAEEWKSAWEKEHQEKLEYSERVHDERQKANVEKLKLVEENARLQSRTDLTPIIDHIEKQSETNERVAIALTELTVVIRGLLTRHERDETEA